MRDPVCGMTVGEGALTVADHPEFGFCSEHCRRTFLVSPGQFLESAETASAEHAGACCGGCGPMEGSHHGAEHRA